MALLESELASRKRNGTVTVHRRKICCLSRDFRRPQLPDGGRLPWYRRLVADRATEATFSKNQLAAGRFRRRAVPHTSSAAASRRTDGNQTSYDRRVGNRFIASQRPATLTVNCRTQKSVCRYPGSDTTDRRDRSAMQFLPLPIAVRVPYRTGTQRPETDRVSQGSNPSRGERSLPRRCPHQSQNDYCA